MVFVLKLPVKSRVLVGCRWQRPVISELGPGLTAGAQAGHLRAHQRQRHFRCAWVHDRRVVSRAAPSPSRTWELDTGAFLDPLTAEAEDPAEPSETSGRPRPSRANRWRRRRRRRCLGHARATPRLPGPGQGQCPIGHGPKLSSRSVCGYMLAFASSGSHDGSFMIKRSGTVRCASAMITQGSATAAWQQGSLKS
jgi:hypothetical protein